MRIAEPERFFAGHTQEVTQGRTRKPPPIFAVAIMLGIALDACAPVTAIENWFNPPPPPSHASKAPSTTAQVPLPMPRPKQHTTHETRDQPAAHEQKDSEIAAIDPATLIGLDPPAVQHLLGVPTAIRQAAPALEWTYSVPGCSFRIVFYPDIASSSFKALKYIGTDGSGQDITNFQPCIRNIMMSRSNGPT